MSRVNTRERIKAAALPLFAERGFAGTSIAAIETAAGLAPRAGAFYRHFESKEALFEELARERITETPGEFDFEGLKAFGDTRAELVALARRFEIAAERQRPYLRLIEESRVTESGRSFEQGANDAMLRALMDWVATKTAAEGLDTGRLAALTMNVFGSWLFYLTKRQQGVELAALDRDTLLEDWATRWSGTLDRTS
ncbi:MAG TPA: helix-turn-helix domain-containing protein [Woeseiaceae bacterium]|nr:helix-turn-helix domain-containing protein [Woeseiaceae bacterium]